MITNVLMTKLNTVKLESIPECSVCLELSPTLHPNLIFAMKVRDYRRLFYVDYELNCRLSWSLCSVRYSGLFLCSLHCVEGPATLSIMTFRVTRFNIKTPSITIFVKAINDR
jgi:hypothetical protein